MSSDKTTLACCRMQRWLLNFPGTISLPDPLERMGQELRLGITDAVTGIAAKQVLILMTFGLYDMAGNLWEIVSDYWTPRYDRRTTVDPIGPEKGQGCVTRGGNWGGHCWTAETQGHFADIKRPDFSHKLKTILTNPGYVLRHIRNGKKIEECTSAAALQFH